MQDNITHINNITNITHINSISNNYIYNKCVYIYAIYSNYIYYIKTIYILCIFIYYFKSICYIFFMTYMYSRNDLLHINNNTVSNTIHNAIRNELDNIIRDYEHAILNFYPIHYINIIAPYIDSQKINDTITCSICLEDVDKNTENKKIRLTLCGHYYCDTCIEKWLSSHDTCPMCKYDFTLHDNYNNSNNTGQ